MTKNGYKCLAKLRVCQLQADHSNGLYAYLFYHTIDDPFQKRTYLLTSAINALEDNELLLKLKEWDDKYANCAAAVIEDMLCKLTAPDFNTERKGKRKASKSNYPCKKFKLDDDNLGSYVTFTAVENGQEISVTPVRYSKRLENKSDTHTKCILNLGNPANIENKLEQLPTSIQNQDMLSQFNMDEQDKQMLDKIKAISTSKESKSAIPLKNFSLPNDMKEWKDMAERISSMPDNLIVEKILDKNFKGHNNFIVFKVDEQTAIKLRSYIFATPRCNPLNQKGDDELTMRQDISELYSKNYGMMLLSEDLKKKLRKFPDLEKEIC